MPEIENKIYDSASDKTLDTNLETNLETNLDNNSEIKNNTFNESDAESVIDNIVTEKTGNEVSSEEIKNNGNQENSGNIENTDNIDNTINDKSPKVEIEIAEALDVYNILTIDDDKWIQRIFSQYLTQWGFHHISAFDPYTGLEEAIKNKPLIIFLDILLPEVHGDMLIKFLKKMEFTAKIPVVIISGNLNKDLIKSTYLSGASGFITKPFNQETLFNKIKEVIDPAIFNRMIKDGKINTAQIKKKPHLGA